MKTPKSNVDRHKKIQYLPNTTENSVQKYYQLEIISPVICQPQYNTTHQMHYRWHPERSQSPWIHNGDLYMTSVNFHHSHRTNCQKHCWNNSKDQRNHRSSAYQDICRYAQNTAKHIVDREVIKKNAPNNAVELLWHFRCFNATPHQFKNLQDTLITEMTIFSSNLEN